MSKQCAVFLALAACTGGTAGGPAATDGGDLGDADACPDDGGVPGPGDPDAEPVEPSVDPAIDGRLVINEIMADNALTVQDDTGAYVDWIELYNPTDQTIPLHGYYVTDELAKPRKARLSEGLEIPAGGYLVLWLDGTEDNADGHLCIKLDGDGEQIALARPDGSFIDRVVFGAQATDFSAAREPDGSDAWRIEWHPSPGAANPDGDGAPVGPEDPGAAAEQVPETGDLTERILGYDELPALELLVAPDDVARLLDDPYTYVPGDLVYDGRRYGPVGVRLKGQNSFQPFDQKPSFRINIDEYVEGAKFFGLDDLTLNNMDDDFSMMHERLAYWVARQLGPASRANHLVLTVNGSFYGLYVNVETVKHHMIARWFDDAGGPLFEATDVDFAAPYLDLYELESGPDDRSMLEGLATALAMPSTEAALAAAADYVNMDQFLDFWAMCAVVGQFDSFPFSDPGDDYFVYADPGSGRLWFVPWGMDETFYSSQFPVMQISSVLAQRCTESPACVQQFADHTWAALAITEDLDLAGEIERVAAQIAPHVAADTRKPYDDATVAEYQMQLWWFVTGRRDYLSGMLPPPSE